MCKSVEEYPWSSHHGFISSAKKWDWLYKDFLLGMFAALLAQMALDCPPEDSIAWVREYVNGAVETTEQHQYVLNFYNHHK